MWIACTCNCYNEICRLGVRPNELVGTWPRLTPAPTIALLLGHLPESIMHHGGHKYYKTVLILGHYGSHISPISYIFSLPVTVETRGEDSGHPAWRYQAVGGFK